MWQGQLGLKNDTTAVQMHFVAGNKDLIPVSLPQLQTDGTVGPIRIAQRMRLEPAQLEGVAKRMQVGTPSLQIIQYRIDHRKFGYKVPVVVYMHLGNLNNTAEQSIKIKH